MSKHKKKNKKKRKDNRKSVEMAAEQLAYILWEQIKHNRRNKLSEDGFLQDDLRDTL